MEETLKLAKSELGIRKPVKEVFNAFIEPDITTKFWFTHSSGKVKEGATIEWRWEMYNLIIPVTVLEVVDNKKILIEWGEGMYQSTVLWEFNSVNDNLTFLTIKNYGFKGNDDELLAQIKDSTKGFRFVLSGLKSWLEYKIQLRLVEDAFPIELMTKK
ncbi:SRPBCC family protein [Christiangramia salexigens]|uniref:Polyketide cyclase n=1 Tax=Christiangramia salexigens TaxID=1913577 RepID=A0A1L3J410_9FLAO|nr:SRPBCC family protein [Christiangramia salexigens]APG59844.1 polyketide cyclase [Christiangramia salexigens]